MRKYIILIGLLFASNIVFSQKPYKRREKLVNKYSLVKYKSNYKIKSRINELNFSNFIQLLDQIEANNKIKFTYLGESYPGKYTYVTSKNGVTYKVIVLKNNLKDKRNYKTIIIKE